MEKTTDIVTPPVLTGWMRKQGRKGLIKNWKRRYFVLKSGKLSYFENEAKQFPLGENLKGELNLMNTELEIQDDHGKQQIYIVAFNGENNLLMETETETESNRWLNALKQHIRFANKVSVQQQSAGAASTTSPVVNPITAMPTNNIDVPTTKVAYVEADSDDDCFVPPSSTSRPVSTLHKQDTFSPVLRNSSASSDRSSPLVVNETPVVNEPARDASQTISPSSKNISVSNQSPKHTSNEAEKVLSTEFQTVFSLIDDISSNLITITQRLFNDPTFRTTFLQSIMPKVQNIVQGISNSFLDGNPGERGEELLVPAYLIFAMMLLGFGHWIFLTLRVFIVYLLAPLLILIGMSMLGCALWELDTFSSFWSIPNEAYSKKHHLVTSGVFGIIRHPFYSGMILWISGIACWKNDMIKLVAAIALFVLIAVTVEKEEQHLLKKHPKEYPNYQSKTKYRLLPFIY